MNSMRTLGKEVIIYGISGTIARFIGMFLMPIYTRIFTPSDYGVIGMINIIGSAVVIVADLQIIHGMARYFNETEGDERRSLIGTGYSFTIGLAVLFGFIIFWGSTLWSSLILHTTDYAELFKCLGLQIPLSVSFSYMLYLLRLRHQPVKYMLATLGMALFSILCGVLLVIYMKLGLIGAILAQVLGFVFGNAIALFFEYRDLKVTIHWNKLKQMAAFGFPMVPAVAGTWLQQVFGQVLILSMISLSELGIYSVALRVASALFLFQMAFALAWSPYALSVMNKPGDKEAYADALRIYASVGFLIAIPFIVFAREIIVILTDPNFYSSYKLIGVTAIAVVVEGIPMIAGVGTIVTKKTKYNSIAYYAGLVVTIIVTIYAIKELGVIGVPLGLLSGRLVQSIIIYHISQKLYFVQHDLIKLYFVMMLVVVTLALSVFMANTGILLKLMIMIIMSSCVFFLCLHTEVVKAYQLVFAKAQKDASA
ncbi:MAG: oligosaccharide flippase family protein [Proteobacteria bacterium]|nr:oligosaccharide flippase family protein [Pseudomonadota bacterium]